MNQNLRPRETYSEKTSVSLSSPGLWFSYSRESQSVLFCTVKQADMFAQVVPAKITIKYSPLLAWQQCPHLRQEIAAIPNGQTDKYS